MLPFLVDNQRWDSSTVSCRAFIYLPFLRRWTKNSSKDDGQEKGRTSNLAVSTIFTTRYRNNQGWKIPLAELICSESNSFSDLRLISWSDVQRRDDTNAEPHQLVLLSQFRLGGQGMSFIKFPPHMSTESTIQFKRARSEDGGTNSSQNRSSHKQKPQATRPLCSAESEIQTQKMPCL